MDLIKNNYLLVAQIVSRDDLFCMISDLKVVKSELAPQFGEHLKICRLVIVILFIMGNFFINDILQDL